MDSKKIIDNYFKAKKSLYEYFGYPLDSWADWRLEYLGDWYWEDDGEGIHYGQTEESLDYYVLKTKEEYGKDGFILLVVNNDNGDDNYIMILNKSKEVKK